MAPAARPGSRGRALAARGWRVKPAMARREWVSAALAAAIGWVGVLRLPFPEDNVLLELVSIHRPALFYTLKTAYLTMFFTTPYIACSILLSLGYIFIA